MNIAIISPEFPPLTNFGGVATFNKNLAKVLASMGHKVYVLTFDGVGDEEKKERKDGINIIYVKLKTRFKIVNFFYYKFPLGILRVILGRYLPDFLFFLDWNIFSFIAFRNLNKKISFSVIHTPTYNGPAFFIAAFYRKIFLFLHSQGPEYLLNKYKEPSLNSKVKSLIEKIYMTKYSSRITTCSNNVLKEVASTFPSSREEIVHIPNFIDARLYKNNEQLDKNNIVFFGRLEYRKGPDILLNSFIRLAKTNTNLRLYFIGANEYGFKFKNKMYDFYNLLEKIDIHPSIRKRIFVFPRINDMNTLIEFLKNIKGVAVFPSRYEPFGFVYIEAMALGYLVIASNRGGGKEITHHGKNGFLVQPKISSLTNTLKKVSKLTDKEIAQITTNATLTVIKNFSLPTAKRQIHDKLYRDITH